MEGRQWPSGLTRTELLSLSEKDREAVLTGLRLVLAHTRRAQAKCMEGRERAFKFRPSDEPRYKAQHEAYQRGIHRLYRLIELFKED